MQGLGATGAQQSKDCSFEAGKVPGGAPLRISWFLVIFFAYQVIEALNPSDDPVWVRVSIAVGNEAILLLTVLCHEMGHGTMAKRLGGEISQVLLWPFGGICFTTRAPNRNSRQKLVDDLWIVGAGPATHLPMSAIWLAALMAMRSSYSLIGLPSAWRMLIPYNAPQRPFTCFEAPAMEGCLHSYSGVLFHYFLMQAVQLNVMLFVFNVFFPMYPMDGAKLIVCSLQLCCGASARTAAKVLIGTSIPLSVYFIYNALHGGMGGNGGAMAGVSAYMGFMCLMETYKIYQLYKSETLHTHPLFETARSSVRSTVDSAGATQRLNDSQLDDVEQAPTVRRTELQPFAGSGHVLSAPASADTKSNTSQAAGTNNRTSWLARVEQQGREKQKTVDQLQDERAEREQMEQEQEQEQLVRS